MYYCCITPCKCTADVYSAVALHIVCDSQLLAYKWRYCTDRVLFEVR